MPPRSYHFSVDDVFHSLIELSDSSQGLFDNPFFSFLNQIHDRFGTEVDLYLFRHAGLNGRRRSLSEVSDCLRPQFQEHSWIRFGPHALEYDIPPYAQTPSEQETLYEDIYSEIARFAGAGRTTRWVRLHCFSECHEMASYFRSRQVEALFTTDKPATSYRLPSTETEQLRRNSAVDYAGIRFLRSHIRVENLVDQSFQTLSDAQLEDLLENLCPATGPVIVFTHENEIERAEVREMTVRVLSWLHGRDASEGSTWKSSCDSSSDQPGFDQLQDSLPET